MYAAKVLPVIGHRDLPVPNTFLHQEGAPRHLAIIFPGRGYTCDRPLLYYTADLLLAHGADVLLVEYAYHARPEFEVLPEAAQEQWFLDDVRAALRAGLAQHPYPEVTLIGKSLGTRAMGHLLTTEPALATARAIWLTPLLRLDALHAQIRRCRQPSLLVIGTADPHYDPALLASVAEATGGQVMAIAGADHGLEIPGDLWQTLAVLDQVLRGIRAFLAR